MTYQSAILTNNLKPVIKDFSGVTAPSLPTSAVFDKVINIKLTRGKLGLDETSNSVIIRSDYELIKTNNKIGCQIVKCSVKPKIRVKYTALTGDIGVKLDIYISNFFIYTPEGTSSVVDWTNSDKNPLSAVQVVMGYAPMFEKPESIEDFYGVTTRNGRVRMELAANNGACKLNLNSISVITSEGIPPNQVIHIKGFVNNIDKGFISKIENKGLADTIDAKEEFNFSNKEEGGKTFTERLFYNLIQSRFLRNSTDFLDIDEAQYIDASTGFLNSQGADEYGCKILIPEGSKLLEKKVQVFKDEDGEEVLADEGAKIYLHSGNSVSGTLLMIRKDFFPQLKFAPLASGNWVVWHTDDLQGDEEDPDNDALESMLDEMNTIVNTDLNSLGSDFVKVLQSPNEVQEGMTIPAVYTIALSKGIANICSPYFATISPFQKLKFNSRYILTDAVADLANLTKNSVNFYSLGCTVDFSTVGAENKQVIQATCFKEET